MTANQSVYQAVMRSPQWEAWYEHAEKNHLFDVAETAECNWMSDEHFQAFLQFVIDDKRKSTDDIEIEDWQTVKEIRNRYGYPEDTIPCAVEQIQKQGGIPMVVCKCPKCNIVSF